MFTRSLVYDILYNKFKKWYLKFLERTEMDVSSLSAGLFKVNFPFVSSCASSVVKAVLFLLENLNGNRIMMDRKTEAHWPSISSAHRCESQSAVCPLVERSWTVSDSTSSKKHLKWWKTTQIHKKMNKECRWNEHKIFFLNWWGKKWLKTFQKRFL